MPMSEREYNQKKEDLIRLIDQHPDNWVKAAFFSDEVVEVIMEGLYEKWASSGEVGIPLDYATEEELNLLYKKALKYARLSTTQAMQIALSRMGYGEGGGEGGKRDAD